MRILIVDDAVNAAERIVATLSADPEFEILTISDGDLPKRLAKFGLEFDVALIDLDLSGATNHAASGAFSGKENLGLAVCQQMRQCFPSAVIVGYSKSFSQDDDESKEYIRRFFEMGADFVWPLAHLTLTPVRELRLHFEDKIRNRRLSAPDQRSRTKIFIGSSVEGLPVARCIQNGLQYDHYEVEIWDQTTFGATQVSIESLEKAIREFKFAIFVLTPDDRVVSRDVSKLVPRDNVIFETGLFIGSIGRSRTFGVRPRNVDISLPTDLNGINFADYDGRAENLESALGPACNRIRDAISMLLGTS